MKDGSRGPEMDPRNLEPFASFLGNCRSANTEDSYYQDLKVLQRYLLEHSIDDPSTAQPSDLVKFASHLAKPGATPTGKPRPGYSTRTIKRILAAVRSFYQYLAAIQAIQSDPTVVFKALPIRSPQRNPRPLTSPERVSLLKGLRSETFEELQICIAVRLGYQCGLRVSEICGLKRLDLDLAGKTLTVIGKGDKQRTVPMTEDLSGLLARLLVHPEKKIGPYVFPSPRDPQRPMNPQHIEIWVKKAADWAGLPDPGAMTVHVLRHSFGTQLAESGASVYEIRDLMGHSSIVVSENYVKLASTSTRDAHRKAFGAHSKVHSLQTPRSADFRNLLQRHRKILRAKKVSEDF